MRRTTWAYAAVLLAASGWGWRDVHGQVVDSPDGDDEGGIQMTPGSDKGAVKEGGGAKGVEVKTAYVAPSEDEQLSRALLELKSQRVERAAKYAAGDARLRDIDGRIRELREKIGARSGLFVDTGAESGSVPVYPRIVQSYGTPAEYGSAATSGAKASGATVGSGATANRTAAVEDTPENMAVRRALTGTTGSFTWEAVGLEKCLKELGDKAHVNVFVNWPALQAVGVDRNTPVTLHVVDVNVEKVLKAILAMAGGANAALGYTADEGVLTVSSREDLSSAKYQVVKVFDVRDLVATDAGAYPDYMAMQLYGARANGLIDTIKSTVAPDTWKDSGGTIGSIRELNGLLIVNQTVENQMAIAELLGKLRGR